MGHEADFATKGRWSDEVTAPGDGPVLGDNQGVYGVHMVLLRTGRVLLWSGRVEGAGYIYRSWTFDPTGWSPPDPPPAVEGRWFLNRFDPGGANASPPGPWPTWADDNNIDLFCAHQVTLEDGRVLVLGGAGGVGEGDARGNKAVFLYDPIAERWDKGPHLMNEGRWYPTAVTLPDARVAVFSGRATGPGIAAGAEVLGAPSLHPATISGGNRQLYIYPGLMLVRGGRIYYVPTAWQYEGAGTDINTVLATQGPTGSFEMTGAASGVWQNYTAPATTQPLRPVNSLREEGTFVLLPPAQAGRVMVIGGGWAVGSNLHASSDAVSCEILETQGGAPRWVPGGRMRRPRVNVHAVLLPDGKVLIAGGHNNEKRNHTTDQVRAELFDPTVPFDPANPSAAFTDVGEMHTSRNYHATAVLLPDARVLFAGGEDNQHFGGNQTSLEIYEPPYCHNGPRPQITAVRDTGGPNDHIGYGGGFVVQMADAAQAAATAQVVLMRPGAPTHHTDTEQRHVPLSFTVAADELRVTALNDPSVAPPGWYMLFTVDSAGRPCERASWVHLSNKRCHLVTDRSTLSYQELEAAAGSTIPDAVYVSVDGFLPSELGITSSTPSAAQLAAWAPMVGAFEGATAETRVVVTPTALHCEDPVLPPDRRQRFTFEYSLSVTDLAAFPPGATEVRHLDLRTTHHGYHCHGRIRLVRQPNPYLLDGPVSWLATDVRVFKLRAGESRFGVTLDAVNPDPVQFIRDVTTAFDANPALDSHPYTTISEDPNVSKLQWATNEGGARVFNFAVARMRYRALTLDAVNVRAFFRLFTVTATNLDFDPATTYRRAAPATGVVPLLGIRGTEVVTIPFFATPRVDTTAVSMATQEDNANRKTLPASPSGQEQRRYFGAWLDFNQTEARFPRYPGLDDGPYTSGMLPIAELIKGRHQCVVAEIEFPNDPTPLNANPASEDNLSQRNLAIEGSDNPGGAGGHTVALSFDIAPTWSAESARKALAEVRDMDLTHAHAAPVAPAEERPRTRPRPRKAVAAHDHDHDHEHTHEAVHEAVAVAPRRDFALGDRVGGDDLFALEPVGRAHQPREHDHASPPDFRVFVPDELMILWGELPLDSRVELFLPSVSADHVVRLAEMRDGRRWFERVDDHTVSWAVGDASHVPLPVITGDNVAALLTVRLPDSVRVGEEYRVVVKQVSHLQQRVVGSFELRIPVGVGGDFLSAAQDDLAVLAYVGGRLPETDRWKPIFDRTLDVLRGRVRDFGGDPEAVKPSLEGHGGGRPGLHEECPPRRPGLDDLVRCAVAWCPPLRLVLRTVGRLATKAAGEHECDDPTHDHAAGHGHEEHGHHH